MKGVPIAVFGAKGTSEFITEFISDENTVDPTIEDSYYKNLNIDGKEVQINILDTAGQDDFSPLRTSHMRQGKGFIFLYNIDDHLQKPKLFTMISLVLKEPMMSLLLYVVMKQTQMQNELFQKKKAKHLQINVMQDFLKLLRLKKSTSKSLLLR